MNDPDLILVDEPTASLDTERGRQVVEMLALEITSRGPTGLMVTHDPRMPAYAGRVLHLRDGRLIDETTAIPEEALASTDHPFGRSPSRRASSVPAGSRGPRSSPHPSGW